MQNIYLYTFTCTDTGRCMYQYMSNFPPRSEDYAGLEEHGLVLSVTH